MLPLCSLQGMPQNTQSFSNLIFDRFGAYVQALGDLSVAEAIGTIELENGPAARRQVLDGTLDMKVGFISDNLV